jgi:hypothetical protein
MGPSFILSEDDRSLLREQLRGAERDEELAGLQPVGWFVGHTRSPLVLSEREAEWFNEFFPEPESVTVLVKPERFQPTRFVFLTRGAEGKVALEPATEPVILPLSTQGGETDEATPAIPAPRVREPRPAAPIGPEAEIEGTKPSASELGAEEEETDSFLNAGSKPAARPADPKNEGTKPDEEPIQAEKWPPPSRSQVTRVRTPRPEAVPPAPVRNEPTVPIAEQRTAAPLPPPPRTPAYSKEPSDGTNPSLEYPYARLARTSTADESTGFGTFGLHSIAVLLLAAVLGCLAGYWAYLQLPSPVIPVSVREQSGQLVVEWPATQTAGVDYAALQVNDGQWLTLSNEQKDEGRALITPPAGDLKIDLVAKHWLRDSRGIVKYIRTPRSGAR